MVNIVSSVSFLLAVDWGALHRNQLRCHKRFSSCIRIQIVHL